MKRSVLCQQVSKSIWDASVPNGSCGLGSLISPFFPMGLAPEPRHISHNASWSLVPTKPNVKKKKKPITTTKAIGWKFIFQ